MRTRQRFARVFRAEFPPLSREAEARRQQRRFGDVFIIRDTLYTGVACGGEGRTGEKRDETRDR